LAKELSIGVVYPQIEFGNDSSAIRDYAQLTEGLGYTHILAYDHVLGANPNRPGGWQAPYSFDSPFQEPFILFAYMAGFTQTIGFTTGVIILPQRQTALVAKQAATLDVLSNGRLRLGIGLGWNWVEYQSLNEDFHNRGRRIEEQVAVLRRLWTEPLVIFEGKWHSIPDAGLNPLPIQRPIPIWFGGQAEEAVIRAARLGDGWMPNYRTVEEARPALEMIKRTLEDHGRDFTSFGLEARLPYAKGDQKEWESFLASWEKAGATHITLNTMGCGFISPEEHLAAIENFARFTQIGRVTSGNK
jgi:probable F420-dependent oxidoreductase